MRAAYRRIASRSCAAAGSLPVRTILLLASLVAAFVPGVAAAQTATISGTVRSQTQAPVRGAAVRIPALDLVTYTNDAGSYRLLVPAELVSGQEVELVVESVGFRAASLTVPIAAGSIRRDVTLTEDAIALDAVLVTGTAGRAERRAQAASIAGIDAARVTEISPVTSVANILQSRVPGVYLQQKSGAAGSAQRIRIRGISSISLDNEPLVFIDGVRADSRAAQIYGIGGQTGSRLNDIRPEDIESIEVVKGPAAATLYGADASAGVIQIITKRGRADGRFTQSISAEYGVLEPNFTMPDNYAVCLQTHINSGAPACVGRQPGEIISDNPAQRYDVFKNGRSQNLSWNLRGGGERYGIFLSAGLGDETGVLPNNHYRRRGLRANFDFLPLTDLRVDVGFGLTHVDTRLPLSDDNIHGFMGGLLFGLPLTIGLAQDGWSGTRQSEAMSAIYNVDETWRFQPRISASYQPFPWFTNRLLIGGDLTRTSAYQFFPRNDRGWYSTDQLNSGQIQQGRQYVDRFTIDYLANAMHNLTPTLRTDVSFGMQTLVNRLDLTQATGIGLASNSARAVNAAAEQIGSQTASQDRSHGFLGQVQLSSRDRLYLQVGGRLDQHSAFGAESRAFFSPKVGVSYVISDEPFWQRTFGTTISTLRLRTAYGTTGRSPSSGASATYVPSPYTYLAAVQPGLIPQNPGNPELRPERGTEHEAGLEAGLLDDRLSLEINYFNKVTKDLILARPLAPSAGFTQNPLVNIGGVRNRGFEMAATARVLALPRLGWELRASANTLRNEVTDLGGVEPFGTLSRTAIGRPVGSLHTHSIRRIDLARGVAIVSDTLEFVGNTVPGREGTISSTLTVLTNFTVYAQFDYVGDIHRYNNVSQWRDRQRRTSERWVRQNEILTPEERLRAFGPFENERGEPVAFGLVNGEYIEPADFVRFREISLSYRLPEALARRVLRGRDATVTFAGRNLATWTDYRGLDPESSHNEVQEFNTLPVERRFLVRFNIQY